MAQLTRIGVGGAVQTYGVITDKSEGVVPRPGDLFTRIAVGGVGIIYSVTDKAESEVEIVKKTGSMLSSLLVRRRMHRSRR